MNAYADTGFVVSLYREESTSARAAALMARQTASVRLSQLGELEFRNALHLAVFRGELAAGDAALKKRLFWKTWRTGFSPSCRSPLPNCSQDLSNSRTATAPASAPAAWISSTLLQRCC